MTWVDARICSRASIRPRPQSATMGSGTSIRARPILTNPTSPDGRRLLRSCAALTAATAVTRGLPERDHRKTTSTVAAARTLA